MAHVYSAARVRVTWGVEPSTDDKLRTDQVNLSHGRAKGWADDDTIRRVLAIMHLRNVESARFVALYKVVPLRTPLESRKVWNATYCRALDLGHNQDTAERMADDALLVLA